MKRIKLISVLLIIVLLSSASTLFAASAPTEYTVYLCPGAGQTIGEQAGQNSDTLFLTNYFTQTAVEGADLLEPDERTGYTFNGWSYGSDGSRKTITTMPAVNNLILYANWSSTANILVGGGTGGGDDGGDPVVADGLYLSASVGSFESNLKFTKGFSSAWNTDEYALTGVSLTAGQTFMLRSNVPILTGSSATTFPSKTAGQDAGYTFAKSGTHQTKDLIYVDSTTGATTSNNSLGNHDVNFGSNNPAQLKVLQSGTYSIYVIVWGANWVQIYASKA